MIYLVDNLGNTFNEAQLSSSDELHVYIDAKSANLYNVYDMHIIAVGESLTSNTHSAVSSLPEWKALTLNVNTPVYGTNTATFVQQATIGYEQYSASYAYKYAHAERDVVVINVLIDCDQYQISTKLYVHFEIHTEETRFADTLQSEQIDIDDNWYIALSNSTSLEYEKDAILLNEARYNLILNLPTLKQSIGSYVSIIQALTLMGYGDNVQLLEFVNYLDTVTQSTLQKLISIDEVKANYQKTGTLVLGFNLSDLDYNNDGLQYDIIDIVGADDEAMRKVTALVMTLTKYFLPAYVSITSILLKEYVHNDIVTSIVQTEDDNLFIDSKPVSIDITQHDEELHAQFIDANAVNAVYQVADGVTTHNVNCMKFSVYAMSLNATRIEVVVNDITHNTEYVLYDNTAQILATSRLYFVIARQGNYKAYVKVTLDNGDIVQQTLDITAKYAKPNLIMYRTSHSDVNDLTVNNSISSFYLGNADVSTKLKPLHIDDYKWVSKTKFLDRMQNIGNEYVSISYVVDPLASFMFMQLGDTEYALQTHSFAYTNTNFFTRQSSILAGMQNAPMIFRQYDWKYVYQELPSTVIVETLVGTSKKFKDSKKVFVDSPLDSYVTSICTLDDTDALLIIQDSQVNYGAVATQFTIIVDNMILYEYSLAVTDITMLHAFLTAQLSVVPGQTVSLVDTGTTQYIAIECKNDNILIKHKSFGIRQDSSRKRTTQNMQVHKYGEELKPYDYFIAHIDDTLVNLNAISHIAADQSYSTVSTNGVTEMYPIGDFDKLSMLYVQVTITDSFSDVASFDYEPAVLNFINAI